MNHSSRQDKNSCRGAKENTALRFDEEGNFLRTLPADGLKLHSTLYSSVLLSHPFFFLHSAGPLFRSPCELLPVGVGHPVQATLRSLTVLSGCASRATSSLPQEVHVINLRARAADRLRSTPAEVSRPEHPHCCHVQPKIPN